MRGPTDAKEYTGAFVMEDEIRSSAHRKRSCRQCRDPKHSGASVQAFVFALSKYPFCYVQYELTGAPRPGMIKMDKCGNCTLFQDFSVLRTTVSE